MPRTGTLSPAEAIARGRQALLKRQRLEAQRKAERQAALRPWSAPACLETTVVVRSKPAPGRWPKLWQRPAVSIFCSYPEGGKIDIGTEAVRYAYFAGLHDAFHVRGVEAAGLLSSAVPPRILVPTGATTTLAPKVGANEPQNSSGSAIERPVRSSEGKRRRRQSASPLTQHGAATPGDRFGDGSAGNVAKPQLDPTPDRVERPSDVQTGRTRTYARNASVAVEAILRLRERKAGIPPARDRTAPDRGRHGDWSIPEMKPDQCRFPCTPDNARPEDHRFCGAPIHWLEGKATSYCATHLRRVFVSPRRVTRASGIAGLSDREKPDDAQDQN